MKEADVERVLALRGEAHNLVRRLNGGERGILAGSDALGCQLETITSCVLLARLRRTRRGLTNPSSAKPAIAVSSAFRRRQLDLTLNLFAEAVIETHIERELLGKLVTLEERYRPSADE